MVVPLGNFGCPLPSATKPFNYQRMTLIKVVVPLDSNPVPYQQGLKSRPVFNKAGGFQFVSHYKDRRLTDYQELIRLHAISERNRQRWAILPKFFKYELLLVFRTRNHGDMDNCEKAIMDALEGVLFENDKWACDKRVRFAYGSQARIEITIEKAEMP